MIKLSKNKRTLLAGTGLIAVAAATLTWLNPQEIRRDFNKFSHLLGANAAPAAITQNVTQGITTPPKPLRKPDTLSQGFNAAPKNHNDILIALKQRREYLTRSYEDAMDQLEETSKTTISQLQADYSLIQETYKDNKGVLSDTISKRLQDLLGEETLEEIAKSHAQKPIETLKQLKDRIQKFKPDTIDARLQELDLTQYFHQQSSTNLRKNKQEDLAIQATLIAQEIALSQATKETLTLDFQRDIKRVSDAIKKHQPAQPTPSTPKLALTLS